jgi:glycosyltransferase involved in cell wall biosynthesis
MYDLSVLIPSRNEMFLSKTVECLLKNIRGNTEVIVVLDGEWADPAIPDDKRVTLIYNSESIGQRAATNQAARLSSAKYVMKVDAHCDFDEGFDVKLMADMQEDWTVVPVMFNHHAFDWLCTSCKNRLYQGPTPLKCAKCGGKMVKDMIWQRRPSRRNEFYRFDTTLHFQYWSDRKRDPKAQTPIAENLSLQGSCFMVTRKKYWELNLNDEAFGSWGQQGSEVALKTWLSGGKVMLNKKTWYSHLFRTQGGDFGFPYPQSGSKQEYARKYCRELFFNNRYKNQIYPLSWLIEKFKPIPEWHDPKNKVVLDMVNKKGEEFYHSRKTVKKGILFFTDNRLRLDIAHAVQQKIRNIGIPIVSVSLRPMANMGKNIYLPLRRGYLTYFTQILAGLEASDADIIYMCEHDVLYHPSNFEFIPPEKTKFYYNQNWWKVRIEDGHTLHFDANQVSGCVAYREALIEEYKKKVRETKVGGYTLHIAFEPGGHIEGAMIPYKSKYPYIDIRHGGNLTWSRWSLNKYRDQSIAKSWIEGTIKDIPGWDLSKGLLKGVALK